MIKHVKVTYYCPDEEEDLQERFSGSYDYETEEELNKFLEEMEEEKNKVKFQIRIERKIKYYTADEYIKELEEDLLRYVVDQAMKSEKHKILSEGFDRKKGMYASIRNDETKYFLDGKEISKEKYDELSDILYKDDRIRLLKKAHNRIWIDRTISRTFDLSKLTTKDYYDCIDFLSSGSRIINNYQECREKYVYALKNND